MVNVRLIWQAQGSFRMPYQGALGSHKAELLERFKVTFRRNKPVDASISLCPK